MDKFGRSLSNRHHAGNEKNRIQHILPLTSDGNYDVGHRILSNVNIPAGKNDAASKGYVDNLLNQMKSKNLIDKDMYELKELLEKNIKDANIIVKRELLLKNEVLKSDVLQYLKEEQEALKIDTMKELTYVENRINNTIDHSMAPIKRSVININKNVVTGFEDRIKKLELMMINNLRLGKVVTGSM